MRAVRAYHDAEQIIAGATWTQVALNSELSDTSNMHSTTVNNERITIDEAASFAFAFHATWTFENTSGVRGIRIKKTGTVIVSSLSNDLYPSAYHWTHSMSFCDRFAVGDYLTVEVYQENADLTGGLRSVGWNTPHMAGGIFVEVTPVTGDAVVAATVGSDMAILD